MLLSGVIAFLSNPTINPLGLNFVAGEKSQICNLQSRLAATRLRHTDQMKTRKSRSGGFRDDQLAGDQPPLLSDFIESFFIESCFIE